MNEKAPVAVVVARSDPVAADRTSSPAIGMSPIVSTRPVTGTLVTSSHIRANPEVKDQRNKDAALRDRPLRGLRMLSGFTGGPTEWRGGSVYNPADGGTYRGTITMTNDNSLRLRGCIVAPLCKTQTWTRIQ